ncbi:MAG: ribulose-phosphate 3-epimerase [Chitinispirillaceae bacterium]|jgi:ribulose-phosphate 3-epimerase
MISPLFEEIKKNAPNLSVGIMSADLMHLDESVRVLAMSGAKLLHFDIMDGCFCPQLTAGPFFVKGIRCALYKDVHLLVENPLPLIPDFATAGADIITVHADSGKYVHRALQLIAEQKNAADPNRGILRGIALNPGTPLTAAEPLLAEADIVFLVAVNPGFPKQRFIETTVTRFHELKNMIKTLPKKPLLGIDGGITRENIGRIAALGADIIVTGSAIFEGNKIHENFEEMMRSINNNQ